MKIICLGGIVKKKDIEEKEEENKIGVFSSDRRELEFQMREGKREGKREREVREEKE